MARTVLSKKRWKGKTREIIQSGFAEWQAEQTSSSKKVY